MKKRSLKGLKGKTFEFLLGWQEQSDPTGSELRYSKCSFLSLKMVLKDLKVIKKVA